LLAPKIYTEDKVTTFSIKLVSYAQFVKLRLTFLVVLSAAICFSIGSEVINWQKMFWLVLGGFLVTGASNGFNQVLEKKTDHLMSRTQNRPLPQERMGTAEAVILAFIMGGAGIFILWYFMNALSGILGLFALILYVLAYTPLKKISPFAVFVGAFPGAIPPMLGYVAATGRLDIYAWILFAIQFLWQFPHFWAIAWVLDDDYKKAGFKMLPSADGRAKGSALQIFAYSLSLIPVSLIPVAFRMSGMVSAIVILICGMIFTFYSYKLYKSCEIKDASRLMFASFIYLPIVQLSLLLDKI
jgi:heme o synthase